MPKRGSVSPSRAENRRRPTIPDTKWFNNRMDALGLSNAAIAPDFGLAANKIWQMKTGQRAVQVHELLIWARVLRVHPSEIFARLGLEWPRPTVPVVGTVGPAGRVAPAAGEVVQAPDEQAGDVVALRLAQAWPAAGLYRGALLYYEPSLSVHVSAFGRLAVLGFGDHPTPIVGTLVSSALGEARAIALGSGETVTSAQAMSAAPVLWIKQG